VSSCSLARALDDRIMRCGTNGSCQPETADCKALLVASLTHVSSAVAGARTFTFLWYFFVSNTERNLTAGSRPETETNAAHARTSQSCERTMPTGYDLSRDYNCDSTTIRLRYDYDVSRAPASVRRDSTRAKMNMSIFRLSRVVVV